MWWWHGMPFGNKVSQIFMATHDFCHTISFCVPWIYGTNMCHGMPYLFMCHEVFEVMNSPTCVCVLNNLLLIVIMIIILIVVSKKVTHNSLTFLLLNTLIKVNICIKLTYVCRLFSKNVFLNISYLVSYLITHNESSMFKYTYIRLPYQ